MNWQFKKDLNGRWMLVSDNKDICYVIDLEDNIEKSINWLIKAVEEIK